VASPSEAQHEYGIDLVGWDDLPVAGAIVAAVAHKPLVERPLEQFLTRLVPGGVYADVKCVADAAALRARGYTVWRL